MLPASLFIFAWTSFEYVSWVGPMMGGVAFGWGMVSVYVCLANSSSLKVITLTHFVQISANSYIVDAFPKYVASAIAAKTFIRSMAGASVPMFVVQMYNGLGPRWASSLLGFVSIVMLPIPFVFWKWGAQIRAASRRASA